MVEYFLAPRSENTIQHWRQQMWLGFSAERQDEVDERCRPMRALAERGWTCFVSIAPMLGPVRLPPDFLSHGNRVWTICSGEQGPGARPMNPDWSRAVRDQCGE